jgi:hypothetical protein
MSSITADAVGVERATKGAVGFGPLAVAGAASLGAGSIHAAAIGIHAEHRQAAITFAILALLQLGWGALALVGRRWPIHVLGLGVNAAAIGGWILAKTSGISFVDGLGEVESVQWPDALAVALATIALVVGLRRLVTGGHTPQASVPSRFTLSAVGIAVTATSLLGMTQAGTHQHASGEGHAATGHSHGSTPTGGSGSTAAGPGHSHGSSLATKPYDPDAPIDLSGVAGVTPKQQAAAENLIAITLARLPQWSDYRTAEAKGFHSIGDALTGHEHFINWDLIDDGRVLDPDYPEALVYEPQADGGRKLVSAMFMLGTGTTLDDVPELGGKLTQWHIHDDLCFSPDPEAPVVAGITSVGGTCRPPLQKFTPVPMIHVWITKHPCGPFAALDGVGAGQIKDGETRLCDEAHGDHGG